MKNEVIDFSDKVRKAAAWSTATEVLAKILSPITNMILARILSPSDFGVVAFITMITTFADMLTNSGLQKFLIQFNFSEENELQEYFSVAFWSNILFSFFAWGILLIFSTRIASLLGNSDYSDLLRIASIQLPINSFSSIIIAYHRRKLDFKSLFFTRVITSIIPLVFTVPLAMKGQGYMALIYGNLAGCIINAIVVSSLSKWKPLLIFNIKRLRKMFTFTFWATMDSFVLWLTIWIDAFVIGTVLNTYYLGLYKTSLNTVNVLFGVITASVTPVFFSSLSRMQEDRKGFKEFFLNFQRITAYIVLPMGAGIYIYSDLATKILLGDQWHGASNIIGLWALVSAFMIVLSNFNSDAFKAAGKPMISVILQIIHLFIVVCSCFVGVKYGFWALVYTRALIRFTDPLISYIVLNKVTDIGYYDVIRNISKPLICTLIMCFPAIFLREVSHASIFLNFFAILISVMIYFISLSIFSKEDFLLVLLFFKVKKRKN